jgi:4-hydroxy-3-polyprenylbenzoate decarboxylase
VDREIIVGITGASGAIYAARLLRALESCGEVGVVHLVVSRHARVAIREELDIPSAGPLDLKRFIGVAARRIRLHDLDAVEAVISSGSHRTEGMVIAPCSVGTLGKIANGISDSLLTRAAEVCLKEGRRLVLVVRETPLSRVHLVNLLKASEAGATIMPAMPSFYARPQTVEELVDQFLARVLDHFGLEHHLGRRWQPGDDVAGAPAVPSRKPSQLRGPVRPSASDAPAPRASSDPGRQNPSQLRGPVRPSASDAPAPRASSDPGRQKR